MKFIEEIVVEEFIPTVRSMLAEELHARGLTQREVARSIGVSQSSVSKYVHGEVRRRTEVMEHERVCATVDSLADSLADGDMEPLGALIELEVLIRELEAPGELLARMHETAMPGLTAYEDVFRVHDPESPVRSRERVRRSVRQGLRQLERSSAFQDMIPQVGSNLVECLPNASGIDDVAGVPGRIFAVEGRVEIPGDPAFGTSQHVADVLLAARTGGSTANAAINVAYDESLLQALADSGHDRIEVAGDESLREQTIEAISTQPSTTVIAQTGGFGIEPIIYVLATDAVAAVGTVLDTE